MSAPNNTQTTTSCMCLEHTLLIITFFIAFFVIAVVFCVIIFGEAKKRKQIEDSIMNPKIIQCSTQDQSKLNNTQLVFEVFHYCLGKKHVFDCISDLLSLKYQCACCFIGVLRHGFSNENCTFNPQKPELYRVGMCFNYDGLKESKTCHKCIFNVSKEKILLPCTGIKF